MIKIFGINYRVNGESLIQCQILIPFHLHYFLVNSVGIFGFEVIDGSQNPEGSATVKVCLVQQLHVTFEGNHAATDLHLVGSQ